MASLADLGNWIQGLFKQNPQQIKQTPVQRQPQQPIQQVQPSFLDRAGQIVWSTLKGGYQGAPTKQLGTGYGQTLTAPWDTYLSNKMMDTDMGIANKYTDLALKLQSQGKVKEAQNLFQKSRETANRSVQVGQKLQSNLNEAKKNVFFGSIKAGLAATALPTVAANPAMTLGVPALLGGTINKLTGGGFAEGVGRGTMESLPFIGVSQIMSPLISQYGGNLISKVTSNPIAKDVMVRVLSGTTNVLENEIMGKIDNKSPDALSNFLGFVVGASFPTKYRGWEDLPAGTKNVIIQGGRKLGFDVSPSPYIQKNKYNNGMPTFLDKRFHENLDFLAGRVNAGLSIKMIPTQESIAFQGAVKSAIKDGHITPAEGRLLLGSQEKLLYSATPGEKNFTPIKIKEMVKEFDKQDQAAREYIKVLREQGLNADADKLLNALTLKSGGVNEPFVRIKPEKGTYTPLDQTPLNQGYLNQDSGLPTEGLPSQPRQQKNLLQTAGDYLLSSGRTALNNMGLAGKSLSTKIDTMYTTAQRKAGNAVADFLKVTGKMDDPTYERLLNGLRNTEGGLPTNDPSVSAVRKILDAVHAEAKAVGLDIGYLKDYVPQKVDLAKLKMNREAAIEYFVGTKQFGTRDAATGFVDDILNGTDIKDAYNRFGKALPRKMGNLEYERMLDWLPDVLRNDKKLIADYIEQAYSRIEQVRQFGKNNEIGDNLIRNIQKQGYNVQLARDVMNQNLGLTRYNPTALKMSGLARSIQGATKLPLAAITNATQTANTATVGGTRRTLGQIFRYANPAERAVMEDYALRTGATLNGTMQRIMDEWQGSPNILKKLIAPFFGQVENFNRIIAANVGRAKAIDEGVVDPEALIKAGQSMVDRTQFQVRPNDLPVKWNTPLGKVMSQFKSFGFRQAEFVGNEIIKKAVKGDLKPLARFVLLGLIANEVANNMKSFFTGKERPNDIVSRIIEDIPGTGYYQDAVETLVYGMTSKDPGALAKGTLKFIIGPTGSDIWEGVSDTGSALKGNTKPLVKHSIENIPVLGRRFTNENPQLFTNQRVIKIAPTGSTSNTVSLGGNLGTIQPLSTSGVPKVQGTVPSSASIMDKQRITDQISALEKEQKAIYDQSGVNVLGKNFGTMSDQEKIQKMTELESKIQDLKAQQKIMNTKFEMPAPPALTGSPELDKKIVSAYKGDLTTQANNILKLYEAGQMSKEQAETNLAKIKSAASSFATSKKAKAVSLGKIRIPKIANIKIKTPSFKKIKMPKQPKLLTSVKKASNIKIKA